MINALDPANDVTFNIQKSLRTLTTTTATFIFGELANCSTDVHCVSKKTSLTFSTLI